MLADSGETQQSLHAMIKSADNDSKAQYTELDRRSSVIKMHLESHLLQASQHGPVMNSIRSYSRLPSPPLNILKIMLASLIILGDLSFTGRLLQDLGEGIDKHEDLPNRLQKIWNAERHKLRDKDKIVRSMREIKPAKLTKKQLI